MKPLAGQPPTAATVPSSTPSSSPTDTLATLLPILDAFNHRHHNQHRASHWWPVFRITRRAVRALSIDLHRSPRPDSFSSSSSSSSPKCASWLDTHVLPRAYIAFTQLAADNQHAPLGILLLAVLARIHAVLLQLLPDKRATSSQLSKLPMPITPVTTTTTTTTTTSSSTAKEALSADKVVGSTLDRGVAVSRRELKAQPQQNQVATRRLEHGERQKAAVVGSKEAKVINKEDNKEKANENEKKKKKKPKGDELSGLFASLT